MQGRPHLFLRYCTERKKIQIFFKSLRFSRKQWFILLIPLGKHIISTYRPRINIPHLSSHHYRSVIKLSQRIPMFSEKKPVKYSVSLPTYKFFSIQHPPQYPPDLSLPVWLIWRDILISNIEARDPVPKIQFWLSGRNGVVVRRIRRVGERLAGGKRRSRIARHPIPRFSSSWGNFSRRRMTRRWFSPRLIPHTRRWKRRDLSSGRNFRLVFGWCFVCDGARYLSGDIPIRDYGTLVTDVSDVKLSLKQFDNRLAIRSRARRASRTERDSLHLRGSFTSSWRSRRRNEAISWLCSKLTGLVFIVHE